MLLAIVLIPRASVSFCHVVGESYRHFKTRALGTRMATIDSYLTAHAYALYAYGLCRGNKI